ncbi:S-layer homology domain-containing protein [Paenibacillus sp. IITD108]|uniref:S-layer homology domain-containing protein n=1 Tax=Paenibacillus sp. IITD108 TaxID=3116649 RepID=UPI002F3EAF2C
MVRYQEAAPFKDESNVSQWAQDALQLAARHGIVNGYADGSFRPQQHATRAEVVALFAQALLPLL